MGRMDLPELAKKMRDIDFMMLLTRTEGGEIAGRPMSNNADVEYDGDSWFFASEQTRTISDIRRDPKVTLTAQGAKGLLGKPPIFVNIEGQAEIVQDQAVLREHWIPELKRWWPDGVETQGLVLLKVHASRIHYWDGEDEGEIRV